MSRFDPVMRGLAEYDPRNLLKMLDIYSPLVQHAAGDSWPIIQNMIYQYVWVKASEDNNKLWTSFLIAPLNLAFLSDLRSMYYRDFSAGNFCVIIAVTCLRIWQSCRDRKNERCVCDVDVVATILTKMINFLNFFMFIFSVMLWEYQIEPCQIWLTPVWVWVIFSLTEQHWDISTLV